MDINGAFGLMVMAAISTLMVDWSLYRFSESFRKELQILFSIYYKAPNFFGTKATADIKANTAVTAVQRTCTFFEFLINKKVGQHFDAIQSLGNLEFSDFKNALKEHKGDFGQIKKGLRLIFSPKGKQFFTKNSVVTLADIESLHSSVKRVKREEPKYFDDALFCFLSNHASVWRWLWVKFLVTQ